MPEQAAQQQETNGWVRRVKGLAEILATPQGMLAVLLLLFIGMAIGKLPFAPLDRLTSSASSHNAAMLAAIDESRADRVIVSKILDRLNLVLDRLDRRAQLIDCARLNDPDLRKRCLE